MSTEIAALLADLKANYVEKLSALQDKVLRLEQKDVDRADGNTLNGGTAGGLLHKLATHEAIKRFRDKATRQATFEVPATFAEIKSTLTSIEGGSPSTGVSVLPQQLVGAFNDPRRNLGLLDRLPVMPATSNAVEYHRLDGYTNAAAVQASEGAPKAEAEVPLEISTAKVKTYAHHLPVSDQVLADVAWLQQYLRSLLGFGVLAKFEADVVANLLSDGTTLAYTADKPADRISEALAALEQTGYTGSLIVLRPGDWHDLRTERGTDAHYVPGGWNMPAAPSMWGIPVAVSASVTAGTAIVLDTSQVAILQRSGVQIDLGYSGTDFVDNVTRLRAEMRAGFMIGTVGAVALVGFGSP
jgi:HK97 family phage major capsid protein